MSDALKIFLRDINADVVDAWREAFAGCDDVEVSQGDIFGLAADAIVSPANSFGYMDGGIDGVYSMHFGWDLSARLREVLRRDWDGELPVGCAVIVETRDARIPYLVSAPTMRVPMNVADTVNAYLAFRAALIAVRDHNRAAPEIPIQSLLCPGLATFYGCMDPRRSARQMLHAYRVVVRGEPLHDKALDVLRYHRDMTHDDPRRTEP
jgi:O-acetyl-ADP-ribose deacetylase (regulator of RNase III)